MEEVEAYKYQENVAAEVVAAVEEHLEVEEEVSASIG